MIQDISPYQYKNEYIPGQPKDGSIILLYDGRKLLLKKEKDTISFPAYREITECGNNALSRSEYTYLFSIDRQDFYLGEHAFPADLPGYTWEDIRICRNTSPKYLGFAGITGWQLYRWYGSRRFCGRCGSRLEKDKKERMLFCPECKLMEYPKICPAVIIGVTDGDRILMSKYAGREYQKYALLAGYTEIGETLEDTVRREVMEEVGLKVKNITYYKSQPWSFSDTLLVGFFCELDGEDKIVLDQDELSLAQWFAREDIPAEDDDCSLTNEMMMAFKMSRFSF